MHWTDYVLTCATYMGHNRISLKNGGIKAESSILSNNCWREENQRDSKIHLMMPIKLLELDLRRENEWEVSWGGDNG